MNAVFASPGGSVSAKDYAELVQLQTRTADQLKMMTQDRDALRARLTALNPGETFPDAGAAEWIPLAAPEVFTEDDFVLFRIRFDTQIYAQLSDLFRAMDTQNEVRHTYTRNAECPHNRHVHVHVRALARPSLLTHAHAHARAHAQTSLLSHTCTRTFMQHSLVVSTRTHT